MIQPSRLWSDLLPQFFRSEACNTSSIPALPNVDLCQNLCPQHLPTISSSPDERQLNGADGFALYKLERQNFLLLCQRRIFNVLEQQLNGFLTFQ